ncbi:MAG TPA: Fic family protein [Gemmatimonadaceae bacterium]|nr:Fic family protein [Gemmatimonadaceae bacterium]
MRAADFTAESPGGLVDIPPGVPAFVPNPLPDVLPLDHAAVRLLADADHAIGRLVGAVGRMVNPFLIGSPLLHREAILSSRIEGTIATPEQLVLAEIGAPSAAAGDDDANEVLNYIRAVQHGLRSKLPISLRLIRELHGVLMKGVRGGQDRPGEFREVQNFIGRPGAWIGDARFVPPPVRAMHECLDVFERRLHAADEQLPLLVKLALVHYQFEAIHPFRDGNGRIGRLLLPLLLVREGRLDEPVLYLSAYFERRREAYLDLLLAVSQRGAWLEWVRFFLKGVEESATESLAQANTLLKLRERYHERFRTARSFGVLQQLIDNLFASPSTTMMATAKKLKITPAAASANIRKLQEGDVLREVTGRKRDQVFVAHEILRFMGGRNR